MTARHMHIAMQGATKTVCGLTVKKVGVSLLLPLCGNCDRLQKPGATLPAMRLGDDGFWYPYWPDVATFAVTTAASNNSSVTWSNCNVTWRVV